MKLTTKLIAITLLMATAFAGECTKDKCDKCEANTGATIKFCSQCHGAAIFKTGDDRTCTGGTEITNCEKYNVQNAKSTCIQCKSGFQLFVATPVENSTCITCNLATNYISAAGVCTAATAVTDCTAYKKLENKCETCGNSKTINDAATPACATAIANCVVIDSTGANKCTTAAVGYHVKAADKTVVQNIANCDVASDTEADKPTKCKTCKEGFWLTAATTACEALTVANCAASTGTKAECTTCKTGFAVKTDKTACDAVPTGCLTAAYDATTLKCTMCSMAAGYYASDVKGTATFGTPAGWEQVCTKTGAAATTTTTTTTGAAGSSAQIVAFGVILAMISNF